MLVDEPAPGEAGSGPTAKQLLAMSLASCTAITVEMYADRKQWDVGRLEVEVDYGPYEKGKPSHFEVLLKLPAGLSDEQVERLLQIAARCPVHRTISGEVTISDRAERR
jgi:putative redox protein